MTNRQAFLRAICENPFDDAPRLIYADWLEEPGNPEGSDLYAEFIRCQIAVAGFAPEKDIRRVVDAIESGKVKAFGSHELLQGNNKLAVYKRMYEIEGLVYNTSFDIGVGLKGMWFSMHKVARGFISSFRCTTATWKKHGPIIVQNQPIEELVIGSDPYFTSSLLDWARRRAGMWNLPIKPPPQ